MVVKIKTHIINIAQKKEYFFVLEILLHRHLIAAWKESMPWLCRFGLLHARLRNAN